MLCCIMVCCVVLYGVRHAMAWCDSLSAGLCQPYIGMATVLGTFLFGPLVYLLTQLAFLVLYHERELTNQVRDPP